MNVNVYIEKIIFKIKAWGLNCSCNQPKIVVMCCVKKLRISSPIATNLNYIKQEILSWPRFKSPWEIITRNYVLSKTVKCQWKNYGPLFIRNSLDYERELKIQTAKINNFWKFLLLSLTVYVTTFKRDYSLLR